MPLRDVWARERRDALVLYLHVPFCEMRCGFCNLFTTANPKDDLAAACLESLHAALRHAPEELYLYPLYVRPLTGLERRSEAWGDIRLACYRAGRTLLLDLGYEHGPVYCCQEDGIVGLGCGARSYTRGLHYATEYAVGAPGVKAILAEYVARPAEAFDAAEYGCVLDEEEQRRRYVIQSLLQAEGLCLDIYRRRFGTDPWGDLPELEALPQHGLAARGGGRLCLTEAGLERSDAIGHWLYSDRVRECMREYALR